MPLEKELTAESYNDLRSKGKTKQEIKDLYGFKSMYGLNKALKELGVHNESSSVITACVDAVENAGDAQIELPSTVTEVDNNLASCDTFSHYIEKTLEELKSSLPEECKVNFDNLIDVDADCFEDVLKVVIGLNNGSKLTIDLPEHMTGKLIEDIQHPKKARSICAQYVCGEFFAIDMQDVITIQVVGLTDADWVRPSVVVSSERHQAAVPFEFNSEQERYRIECKCGSEYFANMNAGRHKANCRDCKYTVFADRNADQVIDKANGSAATLLTNRYFVTNEPRNDQQSAHDMKPVSANDIIPNSSGLKDIKNIGRDYTDPCKIF